VIHTILLTRGSLEQASNHFIHFQIGSCIKFSVVADILISNQHKNRHFGMQYIMNIQVFFNISNGSVVLEENNLRLFFFT
jgi:hypothetical protein